MPDYKSNTGGGTCARIHARTRENARAYDLSRIGNAKLAIFAFLWFCNSGARNAPNPNEEE